MTDSVPYSKAKPEYRALIHKHGKSHAANKPRSHQATCLSHKHIHQQTKIYPWRVCFVFPTVIPCWKEFLEDSCSHTKQILLHTLHFLLFGCKFCPDTYFLSVYKFLVCWQGVCSAAIICLSPISCTYVTETCGCMQKGQYRDSNHLIYANYPMLNHSTAEICWQCLLHR